MVLNSAYANRFVGEGLTFDDVLLVPAESSVVPRDVKLETHLTKKIRLGIPIMSAAMDTVTESRMAIAIAREGGIGVIHKNMTIEQQAEQVDLVKRSENGVITNPFFLSAEHTLRDADNLCAKFRISGVPIVDESGKLVGIITNRDMKFETNPDRKIRELMTSENLVVGREGTTLEEAKETLRQHKIEKLPIVDKDFHLKGLITIKDIEKAVAYPNAAKDSRGRLLVAAAIGVTADVLDRAGALLDAGADALVLDSAHGHSRNIMEAVKNIKAKYPDAQLIAGNIATAEAAEALIDAGADCVIGTHPHVVQGVEVYNGKPIFYSLGNFVFGGNLNPTDYDGLVVQLTLHFDHQVCDDVQARLIPILTSGVQDGTTNFQPVMAEGEEKDRILNRIQQDSPAEISEIMTF